MLTKRQDKAVRKLRKKVRQIIDTAGSFSDRAEISLLTILEKCDDIIGRHNYPAAVEDSDLFSEAEFRRDSLRQLLTTAYDYVRTLYGNPKPLHMSQTQYRELLFQLERELATAAGIHKRRREMPTGFVFDEPVCPECGARLATDHSGDCGACKAAIGWAVRDIVIRVNRRKERAQIDNLLDVLENEIGATRDHFEQVIGATRNMLKLEKA